MPAPGRIPGDLYVDGALSARSLLIPAGAVSNASIPAGSPGTFIDPTKIGHQHNRLYGQPNTTAVAERKALHRVNGTTATIVAAAAGVLGANVGAATITVDILKNGVTVLTAAIVLTNADLARVGHAGVISGASAACVAGDLIETNITVAAGGGTPGTGLFVQVVVNEDPF